jgi:23S rRNA pseudouridine2605 synthase
MSSGPNTRQVRLQKYLADCGIAARRKCEEYILEGRVLVNDAIVDELPAFVDPQHDRVIVDGTVIKPQKLEYFLVNKPKGVVCSNRDPKGRVRAVDLLPPLQQRLYVVGRLDEDSSGLLLMTNDGELAQHITHPRFGVPKVYRVEIDGHPAPTLVEELRKGVFLSEGKARASHVEILRKSPKGTLLEITLREGRNRQIRRMLAKLGHKVRVLRRTGIGPLSLSKLPVGASRRLSVGELRAIRAAAAEVAERTGGVTKPTRRRNRPRKAAATTGRSGSTPRPSKAAAKHPTAGANPPATAANRRERTKRRIVE